MDICTHNVAALRLSTAAHGTGNDARLVGLFVRCPLSSFVQASTFSNGAVWLDHCPIAGCWVLRYQPLLLKTISVAWGVCTLTTASTRLERSCVWNVMAPTFTNTPSDCTSTAVTIVATPVERCTEACMAWARNVTALHISSWSLEDAYEITASLLKKHVIRLSQQGDLLCIQCSSSSAAALAGAVGGVYCADHRAHVVPASRTAEVVAELLEHSTVRLLHGTRELTARCSGATDGAVCGQLSGIYRPTYCRGVVLRSNHGFPIFLSNNDQFTICYSPVAKAFEVRGRRPDGTFELLVTSEQTWNGRLPTNGDVLSGRIRMRCRALAGQPRRLIGGEPPSGGDAFDAFDAL
jgi:hypothetical protein